MPRTTIRQKKEEFIRANTDENTLEYKGTPADAETYKEYILEGVGKEWLNCMVVYAYACYSGNEMFPQDFQASKDMFLRLIDLAESPSPDWYDALGYIYYYGRTTNGKPDYKKALQYFSVAAWSGNFEAQYKIADMMVKGHGLPKSTTGAARILDRLYGETRAHLESELFDCKFADVALRVGTMYRDGVGFEKDPENALSLLLQAKFAIEKRMANCDYYGDQTVKNRIDEALQVAESNMPSDYFKTRLEFDHPALIGALLRASNGIDVCIGSKGDDNFIIAKRVPQNEEDQKKYLFCVPEMKTCVLADSVVMKIEGLHTLSRFTKENNCFVNHIEYNNDTKIWTFFYLDRPVLQMTCDGFSLEN